MEEVRKLVDSVVGPYSNNEYFEMTVQGLLKSTVRGADSDRCGWKATPPVEES